MKIALGQINVKQGKPTENLAAMREMIAQAKAEKADLIVFPEMAERLLSAGQMAGSGLVRISGKSERRASGVVAGDRDPLRQSGNPADWSGEARA